jgi:hypothetical protein
LQPEAVAADIESCLGTIRDAVERRGGILPWAQ